MANDLAQIVAEKMQVLPIEEQQKVVEFVGLLSKPKKQTLLEKLAVISSRVPDEVWEKVPADGAENIDHIFVWFAQKKMTGDKVFADTSYRVATLNTNYCQKSLFELI